MLPYCTLGENTMIRLWAKIMIDNKLHKDIIYESAENYSKETFYDHISEICYRLNIPTPVVINSHCENYESFNNVQFLPRDFVEFVDFDKLVIESASR